VVILHLQVVLLFFKLLEIGMVEDGSKGPV
jgi:hypothetical protein